MSDQEEDADVIFDGGDHDVKSETDLTDRLDKPLAENNDLGMSLWLNKGSSGQVYLSVKIPLLGRSFNLFALDGRQDSLDRLFDHLKEQEREVRN